MSHRTDRDFLRWVAQTIHQAYHQEATGTWEECGKSICAGVKAHLEQSEPQHSCPACPIEIRSLHACAHNVVATYRPPVDWNRLAKKVNALEQAVAMAQPIMDAHFAAAPAPEPFTAAMLADLAEVAGEPTPEFLTVENPLVQVPLARLAALEAVLRAANALLDNPPATDAQEYTLVDSNRWEALADALAALTGKGAGE